MVSLTIARFGDQSIGHFTLDGDVLAQAARMIQEQFYHQWTGCLIGQVGNELPGRIAKRFADRFSQSSS